MERLVEHTAGTTIRAREQALARIAPALARTGCTAEAELLAATMTGELLQAEALAGIAEALTAIGSTAEAKRIGGTITDALWQAKALARIAKAWPQAATRDKLGRSPPKQSTLPTRCY